MATPEWLHQNLEHAIVDGVDVRQETIPPRRFHAALPLPKAARASPMLDHGIAEPAPSFILVVIFRRPLAVRIVMLLLHARGPQPVPLPDVLPAVRARRRSAEPTGDAIAVKLMPASERLLVCRIYIGEADRAGGRLKGLAMMVAELDALPNLAAACLALFSLSLAALR